MIKSKLNRLKSHMSLPEKPTIMKEQSNVSKSFPLPHEQQWKEFGVTPYFDNDQFCLVRKVTYPLSYKHGKYTFYDIQKAFSLWEKSNLTHPLSTKSIHSRSITFFDTETTGLSSGAGTLIFLLGHAELTTNELIVTQHLLPSPGHEVALYKSFISSCSVDLLMSFNGKSFDWPRVKNRHTFLQELVPALPKFAHFDLYHAAKRLWKLEMNSLKLVEIEKQQLGFTRKDDIPGHLAQFIYFDFVKHHAPESLMEVMRHNERDILSLVTLFTHLTFKIVGEKEVNGTEREQLGKWFAQSGELQKALELYEHETMSPVATYERGKLLKKAGEYPEALDHFLRIISMEGNELKVKAIIEAVKILEHKEKDFESALSLLEKIQPFDSISTENLRVDCEKRVKRLKKKSVRNRV
ncbi:ribonuclease H-like domain-containing protein [Mangrovibacillus cuniculi]|uniref:YprB ribonuclease H-like domain-containing protein n=1 Tax=Mangrovibacillus cuniculi TaxID=2593652 RepID=A0A7S8HFB7_9BACI|nr:ribonuclease H-like domain-containing protein [Mangrovibacillus cuniculi]QPC46658.1 hypothetical protein G8O30_06625 [Mangrovibacillus cuniculi]